MYMNHARLTGSGCPTVTDGLDRFRESNIRLRRVGGRPPTFPPAYRRPEAESHRSRTVSLGIGQIAADEAVDHVRRPQGAPDAAAADERLTREDRGYRQRWSAEQLSQSDPWWHGVWPGVRRAGLPRQSPALTPSQRRRSGTMAYEERTGSGTGSQEVRALDAGGACPDNAQRSGPLERAAMIYQHEAQGADKAITNAIDTQVQAEQTKRSDDEDGPSNVLIPAG